MKLVNGFKLMYEKGVGDERQIYASKSNVPTAEDDVTVPNIGSYPDAKLFYQKDDEIFVSESNIPTSEDVTFTVTSDGTPVIGVADEPAVPVNPEPDKDAEKEVQADEPVVVKKTRSKKVITEEPVEIPVDETKVEEATE